jgi:thiamine biosynthesis protein ThiS
MIEILLNGERRAVPANATLLDLLGTLQLDPRLVVVEHNCHIVRRPELNQARLAAGDAIELVHFVGGG